MKRQLSCKRAKAEENKCRHANLQKICSEKKNWKKTVLLLTSVIVKQYTTAIKK